VGHVPSNERRQGESFPHTGYPPFRVATQVDPGILSAVRALAHDEGRSFRHPCRRGAFHLVEKHRKAHPRPHVMAAYLGSHEKFRSLYKKLAE